MRLSWRDGLATLFVGGGLVAYLLWRTGAGMGGPRVVAGIVLGLGLGASVTAVVYGVGAGLLRASKAYLAVASLLGLVALVAGIISLASGKETAVGVLVASAVALWLMATVRHGMFPESPRMPGPEPMANVSASVGQVRTSPRRSDG